MSVFPKPAKRPREAKLTAPQQLLLSEICRTGGHHVAQSYPPAKVLVSLKYAEWQNMEWRARLVPTELGIEKNKRIAHPASLGSEGGS